MIRKTLLSLALVAVTCSSAYATTDEGIYGRLNLKGLPKPETIVDKTIKASNILLSVFNRPAYIHVYPGDEQHWARHCQQYDACTTPVLFVTEAWFLNVYLPSIGAFDGREQRYREQMGRHGAIDSERRYDAHPE